ncbi:hypothetical protein P879_11277 [Paragonimus westermani]|uniref:Uncharacterized protein n=1 Tax=Paragonimus westermani TaxID=34504 RepID=A0A8T0D9S1_9TREM|nr:hypothetical protein P879_11277 [Paragonimus westermani]
MSVDQNPTLRSKRMHDTHVTFSSLPPSPDYMSTSSIGTSLPKKSPSHRCAPNGCSSLSKKPEQVHAVSNC